MITLSIQREVNQNLSRRSANKLYLIIWLIALIVNILGIHYPLLEGETLTFSFVVLGSYVMWFISLILFISVLTRNIKALAVIILPLTVLSILLPMLIENNSGKVMSMHSGLGIHILISLLAYSVLMLASFQSILLAAQNNHLHNHKNLAQQKGFIRTLPSLEDMEHFLFRLITIGLVLLTLSLASGFYYLENLFGSQVAHKTVLSIISWVIFTALLAGRWKYGWRGKTAVRWTLIGFVILALAFFGSKFIQEFILN